MTVVCTLVLLPHGPCVVVEQVPVEVDVVVVDHFWLANAVDPLALLGLPKDSFVLVFTDAGVPSEHPDAVLVFSFVLADHACTPFFLEYVLIEHGHIRGIADSDLCVVELLPCLCVPVDFGLGADQFFGDLTTWELLCGVIDACA